MRALALAVLLAGCASEVDDAIASDAADGTGGEGTTSTGSGRGSGLGEPTPPTATELLAKLHPCPVIGGMYATDGGEFPGIAICGTSSAVFWKADLDIDCDGKPSAYCNSSTDPSFQNATSATDSNGNPLDAAALPFVVIPLPSTRFDYTQHGIQLGQVIAAIYDDKVEYGVFGDQGPTSIIGEASYAMAKRLGIDPDPSTGGVGSGVTYIVFTGPEGVVSVMEDHAQAVHIGQLRARQLITN